MTAQVRSCPECGELKLIGSRDIVPGWGVGANSPHSSLPVVRGTRTTGRGWSLFIFMGVWGRSPHSFPGSEFSRTQTVNSTDAKTFYPHGLRPWDWEWEEPAASRSLRDRDAMEKAAGLRPAPRRGVPFVFHLVAMGTTARLAPPLTHCSWPQQTPSVGAAHVGHDTTWAVTFFGNCPGCGFARTQIANLTYTKKEFNPMDFVHGRGNGKEEVGLRPTTRWGAPFVFYLVAHVGYASPDLLLAPDPSVGAAHVWTRHNLGSYGNCPGEFEIRAHHMTTLGKHQRQNE